MTDFVAQTIKDRIADIDKRAGVLRGNRDNRRVQVEEMEEMLAGLEVERAALEAFLSSDQLDFGDPDDVTPGGSP